MDLNSPKTFDDKQWWLKIHYRDPLISECTDKVTVRDYVSRRGYGHTLNELYGVWDSASSVEWDNLPNNFYLKVSNASGANIRVDDVSTANRSKISKRLETYQKSDHSMLSREWNYADIPSKIMAERTIQTDTPEGLVDYRFLCSRGKCHGVLVDVDTADAEGRHRTDARRNVYDRDFNLLDVAVSRPRIGHVTTLKPKSFEGMRNMAEALSEPFPFCRVDLYEVGDSVIFGEITFFHTGGCNTFTPTTFAAEMGGWIDLDGLLDADSLAQK